MENIIGQNKASMGIPSLGSLPFVKCSNCGNVCFENVYVLRVLSALQSPDGHEHLIPEPTFRCVTCKCIISGIKDEQCNEDNNDEDSGDNTEESGTPELKLV